MSITLAARHMFQHTSNMTAQREKTYEDDVLPANAARYAAFAHGDTHAAMRASALCVRRERVAIR